MPYIKAAALHKSLLKSFNRNLFFLYKNVSFALIFVNSCIAIDSPVTHTFKRHPRLVSFEYSLILTLLYLFLIYVLEKGESILFCLHQNVRTLSLLLQNLDLDVPLLFLYPYVGRPGQYHWHMIKIHYPQPVACRWYKVKRLEDPKLNLVAQHILLMLYPNMHSL